MWIGRAVDAGTDAAADRGLKLDGVRHGEAAGVGRLDGGAGEVVLGAALHGSGEREEVVLRSERAVEHAEVGQLRLALGERARLIERDGLDRRGLLDVDAAFEEDAAPRAVRDSGEDGGGRRDDEGAR